jgi:hypothetical protein
MPPPLINLQKPFLTTRGFKHKSTNKTELKLKVRTQKKTK